MYQHRDNPPCVMHVCGAGSHERPSGEVSQMPYGATSERGLGLSGVVVGSGIVEKPSADARRSEKRKTIIVLWCGIEGALAKPRYLRVRAAVAGCVSVLAKKSGM